MATKKTRDLLVAALVAAGTVVALNKMNVIKK